MLGDRLFLEESLRGHGLPTSVEYIVEPTEAVGVILRLHLNLLVLMNLDGLDRILIEWRLLL